jgi:hypothetical protein
VDLWPRLLIPQKTGPTGYNTFSYPKCRLKLYDILTLDMTDKIALHPFNKLAKPAQRALAGAGITSLEELTLLTQKEFMQLHGIGKNALQALTLAMADNDLSFKPEAD